MYRDMSLAALEQQYSPSSCIDDINIYIKQYIDQSQQVTFQALEENSLLSDISYGEHADELLDLYLPTTGNSSKLQVYIHGGYWQELSKTESSFAAQNFQQQGHYFAVLNYSLAPNASLSEIVEQNRKAIAWLYQHAENFGYDADQIFISGSSAGAHLAMMMALTPWQNHLPNMKSERLIQGLCLVSGIYDLTPIKQTYINEPLQLSEAEINDNSPLLLELYPASEYSPQIILSHGDNETDEFKRQSDEMKKKLTALGYQVEFQEIAERNHFNVIVDLANRNSWLSQQVLQQMSTRKLQ
jgi:arylformamidase